MDLGEWNQRLADHFSALARDRTDIPLFALEHGLALAEVQALSDELRAHILVSPPSYKHALVWIVYAAEIGYGYAGDEYWQSFEAKTPGWTKNGNRSWIRDAFVAFQQKFAGARPSGPWAEQFSIIAWPITHSILPRDLQQQLARILYDLRHSFSADLFDAPQRLGEFIASRSWHTTARFQNLVQAPSLVGQIAAALLLQGKEDFKPLLHPLTLKRIGDDVDGERRGREWLRGARRAAEERAKIRGLSIGGSTLTNSFQSHTVARAEVEQLGIEPRLVLRPTDLSRWEVSLEIPDLSHLLLRFPSLRDVLAESRCTVAGAAGRPLARGRLLHGPQRVALSRWPHADEVLLKFERIDPQFEYLLRAECMLRPGSSRLFRVASDGLAYESRGMIVRAGSKYVIVSTEPLAGSPLVQSVALMCNGVYAALLDLPSALTEEWAQVLRQLQLTQAKLIEVWPAGLGAVAWDGEGDGEWLASETPTLAIRADHTIDEMTIAISNGPSLSLKLTDTPSGEPIFIELPPLAVGRHKLSVAVRSSNGTASEVLGDLDVTLRIREARPWLPGATPHGLLEVELDPAAPSLDQFWEGQAAVVVRGPAGRRAKCSVRMFARTGEAPSFERQLPLVTLPFSNDEWARHFQTHLKTDKQAARAYDDAQFCEVEFSADELGVFTLRCEREFTPLRWSLRKDSNGFVARLHDDTGTGVPVIERYSFERPTVGEELPSGQENRAPRTGGLYVATLGEFKAMMVVPPIVQGFADLQCETRVEPGQRTPEAISRLIATAHLWGKARLSGDLFAGLRRRSVIRAVTAEIFSVLGGREWTCAENEIRAPNGLVELRRCIRQNEAEPDLGARLKRYVEVAADKTPRQRVNYLAAVIESSGLMTVRPNQGIVTTMSNGTPDANLVSGVGPEYLVWLVEFALRLATDPATLSSWAGEFLQVGVKRLLDVPAIARAARFLVLAIGQQVESLGAEGEDYPEWVWST